MVELGVIMPLAVRQRQVAPTGAVMQAPATPMNSNEYNAIQGTIAAGTNLVLSQADRVMRAEMSSEMADFQGFVATQKAEAAKFRQENEDEDLPDLKSTKYKQDWESRQKLIGERRDRLKYADTKRAADEYITVNKPAWEHGVEQDGFASKIDKSQRKFIEFQGTVLNEDYRDELLAENSIRKQNGQPELTDRQYRTSIITQKANELADTGVIDQRDVPGIIAKFEQNVDAMESQLITNNIKTQYQGIIDAGGTLDDARKVITEAYNGKLISPSEREKLDNNLESFVASRNKKASIGKYDKLKTNYSEMAKKIAVNDLTMDDIEALDLDDETKEKWQGYLKGSNKEDVPTVTNGSGQQDILNAIAGFTSGEISQVKAMDIILKQRYDKEKITDADLLWAIDKIENKYPKDVLNNMLSTVKKEYDSFWTKSWETKNVEANSSFITWLDKKLAKGEEPTKDEMRLTMNNLLANIPIEETTDERVDIYFNGVKAGDIPTGQVDAFLKLNPKYSRK